jgi:Trypsin-like peptidase domain
MAKKERTAVEKHVSQAAWSFYRKPLVMLYEPRAQGGIVFQGSGTLVRASSGRAIVLTAKHVVDGCPCMTALTETSAFVDVIKDIRPMPDADVAIATIRDTAREMDALAMEASMIAEGAEADVSKGDTVDVIGFPEDVTTPVSDSAGNVVAQRHGDMIHRTTVAGRDRDSISIVWKLGDVADGSSSVYESAGFVVGARIYQGKPAGISGGAVWKQSSVGDALWTPERNFRMIAIPYAFKDQKEQAVPSARWLPWLREQLAVL